MIAGEIRTNGSIAINGTTYTPPSGVQNGYINPDVIPNLPNGIIGSDSSDTSGKHIVKLKKIARLKGIEFFHKLKFSDSNI